MANAAVTLKSLNMPSKNIVPYVSTSGVKTVIKGAADEISKRVSEYLAKDAGKGIFGHNFDLEGELAISKGTLIKNPVKADWYKTNKLDGYYVADCVDESALGPLEWNESIEWYSTKDGTTWKFEIKQDQDMYAFKPSSQTYANWNERWYQGAFDAWNLTDSLKKANIKIDETQKVTAFAMDWLGKNGGSLKFRITDIPGLGQGGMGTGSGSGLPTPKDCQGNTRRRVIQFKVGFPKAGKMLTATQVVEAVKGKVTIMKLMSPAVAPAVTKDENMLAGWRSDTDAMFKGQFPLNAALVDKV